MAMFRWIKKLFAPPIFEGDEQKTGAARLLNRLLLIALAGTGAFGGAMLLLGEPLEGLVQAMIIILLVVILDLLLLVHRGRVRLTGTILSGTLWISFTIAMFAFGGMHDTALAGYFVAILLTGILTGGRTLLVFGILSTLAVLAVYYAEHSGWVVPDLGGPSGLDDLILLLILLSASVFILYYAMSRLARAYEGAQENAAAAHRSNQELQASRDALARQTQETGRKARYLEATSIVARESASLLDVDRLLGQVTDLISEQFGFYHTGIFMLDSARQWAVLQAASSAGGKKMLARGHRLQRGTGLVGSAVQEESPRIALDVAADVAYVDNPDLPETRSEAALPLRARNELIGVLDVQSTELEAFSQEDVAVLQTLADQVAVAISNAQLFQQIQENLETTQQAYGTLAGKAWRDLFQKPSALSFLSDQDGTRPADGLWEPQMEAAYQTESLTPGAQAGTGPGTLAIPLRVRDQVIGVVDGRKPASQGEWQPEEIELLKTLVEQLEVALESASLYQDMQRRAVREQLVGQVTSRMRQTLDVEGVLRTAIEETRHALGLPEVIVRLRDPASIPDRKRIIDHGGNGRDQEPSA